jgi:hypothetical protein
MPSSQYPDTHGRLREEGDPLAKRRPVLNLSACSAQLVLLESFAREIEERRKN